MVFKEEEDRVLEGILHCTNDRCRHEYPIIDGIPLLVADLRAFIARNIQAITGRRDLAPATESLLIDCCGPDAAFSLQRQHLGIYMDNHYGELPAPDRSPSSSAGSIAALLQQGLSLLDGSSPDGPVIDVGCAVGRTTFELAQSFPDALVLGIDLNFAMLAAAQQVMTTSSACYPKRRVGMVYDNVTVPAIFPNKERVDFWLCDALNLPFADAAFSLSVCLNLLDCVASPLAMLHEVGRLLLPGRSALFATPYDWASAATPVESWLGGHSQRNETGGCSRTSLHRLLTLAENSPDWCGLTLAGEIENAPWTLRLHERGTMQYLSHLFTATKSHPSPSQPVTEYAFTGGQKTAP